ncbi:MAG: C39 family peptidase, partial [Polyangiaceae bacterium]|nr:C39 family peptidase [Polyangiaceae bacterium]
ASVLEQEDGIDEALEALDRALRIRPGFRPALRRKSRVLAHRGEDAQALELLLDPRVDGSCELLAERAEIRLRLRDYAGADADLERAEASTVAAEPAVLSALRHRRAEVAYLRRDYARSARLIRASPHRPFVRFAEALEGLAPSAELPRVELDVPIIRQRHMTCAPASLASIAHFHGDPVDHNSIAFAICYAGTPTHHSRAWAEGRGYVAAEFDVTLDSARRVLDAGLPFVLSTVATRSAHAQVVIGYDLARGSILVRDPSRPELVEFDFALLEAQAFHGPHGLVFAPERYEATLHALELPNRAAWDARHRIAAALEAHDLPAARRPLAELEAQSPGSIHALSAAHAVASYVGDRGEAIAALDALLERFPRAHSLVVARACEMRGRHSVSEVIEYFERYRDRDDPTLLSMLADHLRCIPARRAEAERLFRRALRHAPWEGATHHALADLLYHAPDELPETLERYRFGALLSEHDEHFALAYFDSLCRTGSADAGFRFLEWRAERAEHRSCGPAVTLFEAYLGAGDPERGVQALERLAASQP